jgi:predicted amidophosphoribosyltransferase
MEFVYGMEAISYKENPILYKAQWYQQRRTDRLSKNLCLKCAQPLDRTGNYCKFCTTLITAGSKKVIKNLRLEVLQHYGMQCKCCGETNSNLLSIDHIEGGGRKHKENILITDKTTSLFKWIKKNNFPNGFQILCFNCNMTKGAFGICIHKNKLVYDTDFKLINYLCIFCGVNLPMIKNYTLLCSTCKNSITKEEYNFNRTGWRSRRDKLLTILHYGNQCSCCAENTIEFLSFDHVNGGGTAERKKFNYHNLYSWIQKNQYPDNFQILCYNCNCARGFFGGCH